MKRKLRKSRKKEGSGNVKLESKTRRMCQTGKHKGKVCDEFIKKEKK